MGAYSLADSALSVGAVEDLSTGIAHLDAAACPRGSRELPGLANNLANALRRRFHRLREITDLDAAIEQLQHALDATNTDSVNRPGLHHNLAAALTDAQQAVLTEGGTSTDLAADAITAPRAPPRRYRVSTPTTTTCRRSSRAPGCNVR